MKPSLRQQLRVEFTETRRRTLALAEAIAPEDRCRQIHPGYSPFDWHLGHIGMTEALWTLQSTGQVTTLDPELEFIFANIPQNPKGNRCNLPDRSIILQYLDRVRQSVLQFLKEAPLDGPDPLLNDGYCFRFALAHEWQHQETLIELIHLAPNTIPIEPLAARYDDIIETACGGGEIHIPGGPFMMGTDDPNAYDNERPAHEVQVPSFAIDETSVTVSQWQQFVEDGGYKRSEWWTEDGWLWVSQNCPSGPEYSGRGPFGPRPVHPDEPVGTVNWFEADAYARWAGKRLPTEAEWEKAAAWDPIGNRSRRYPWGDDDSTPARADYDAAAWGPAPIGAFPAGRSALGVLGMAGGLWEWTSSVFAPYDGFVAFPYDGYSKDHFDGTLKVLKGGSWATRGPLLRCSFRNFYSPDYRQGFLGFRCARSL